MEETTRRVQEISVGFNCQNGIFAIAGEFLRLERDQWRECHAQVEARELRRDLTAL